MSAKPPHAPEAAQEQGITPLLTALPAPPELAPSDGVRALSVSIPAPNDQAPERFRHSPIVTKLRVLHRCHRAARRTALLRLLQRIAVLGLALVVSAVLAVLAGLAVFELAYEDPERHLQRYSTTVQNPNGFGFHTRTEYYIKGAKVSQQEHDYFRNTNSNITAARTNAISAGVGTFVLLCAVGFLLLGRKFGPPPLAAALEEQVTAIIDAHPEKVDEWGGPSVLRQRELVEEVLAIEEGRLASRPDERPTAPSTGGGA